MKEDAVITNKQRIPSSVMDAYLLELFIVLVGVGG